MYLRPFFFIPSWYAVMSNHVKCNRIYSTRTFGATTIYVIRKKLLSHGAVLLTYGIANFFVTLRYSHTSFNESFNTLKTFINMGLYEILCFIPQIKLYFCPEQKLMAISLPPILSRTKQALC